jgi:hypothetical protein
MPQGLGLFQQDRSLDHIASPKISD